MKKFLFFLLIVFYAGNLFAQEDSVNIKTGWGNLDYSVPESPAFNLLGNNPDNILKPTSVRSIALNIGNYYLTSGMTIPKNLAIEISPLLLNSKTSLNDYNHNNFLYRMRLSIGTNIQDNGAYEMAEGLRFTLLDKTDLRSDKEFLDKLYQSCIVENDARDKAIEDYATSHNENQMNVSELYSKNPVFRMVIDDLAKKYMLNADTINKIREIKRQELWNEPIWEVGIAAMQKSSDSLINHSSFSKAGLWTTYGTHLSKNDQLLFGGKFGMVDSNSIWYSNIAIGTRYYYGSNEVRGFVQGEYKYGKNMSTTTASLGCVFNITNGIWGQFNMNFIFDNKGNITYSPNFNISFGTPEKKKI